ncbi:MAG TPA: nitroreductase family protein [Thermodesulfobacteriota bacterium]|nr:nitroreductase family protein [Deltaproteobacteria bacterium]HNR12944.1 nitroreductase family protein [Thermodesulfobacteriota bacterium]HNU71432.1 nitroreductase family protein [Thermodesulfobacteriota bacterium]
MDATKAINGWRSIRKYKQDHIPEEILRKVLDAGRRSPSWENVQPWHFIVIQDDAVKEKLVRLASGQKHIAQAPVVIAVCGDLSAWDKPKNREALVELVNAGVINVPQEVIDSVLLKDPVFCVAEHGPAIILGRTLEQLGIAYGFMAIEAVNQGLGMCIVGAFGNEVTESYKELYQEIRGLLAIPETMYLLALLTLGFPDEDPSARPRKTFDAVVSRGKVGRPW